MQIVKVNQFNRVISTQDLRVPKVRSTNPDEQMFYLSSETRPGEEYVIRTRQLWVEWVEYLCSCPDYTIRRWVKHEDCKHIAVVKAFASRVGGVNVLADLIRHEHGE